MDYLISFPDERHDRLNRAKFLNENENSRIPQIWLYDGKFNEFIKFLFLNNLKEVSVYMSSSVNDKEIFNKSGLSGRRPLIEK